MKVITILTLCLVAVSNTYAFTTKKRESRPAFNKNGNVLKEEQASEQEPQQQHQQYHYQYYHPSQQQHQFQHQQPVVSTTNTATSSNQAIFAVSPNSMALSQEELFAVEDQVDVGYGTALLSCMVAVALGFALGYGT